jgi:hypothetical protein
VRAFLCERAHAGAGSGILSTGAARKGGEGDEGNEGGDAGEPTTAPTAVERGSEFGGSDPLATKLRSGDACCELAISENLKIGELKRRLYSALSANGQLSLATSASALRLFKRSGARTGGLLRDAKTVRSEGL